MQQGFEIKRTKIEAMMSSRGVPITDEEAKRLKEERLPQDTEELDEIIELLDDSPNATIENVGPNE